MKKLLLIFGGIAGFSSAFAQTLSPQVFASGGTNLTGTNATMEFTIGEVATSTLTAGSDALTQGFNQPEIEIVAVEEFIDVYTIQLYPNPTEQFITVETNSEEELQVEVFDALGKKVIDPHMFNQKVALDVHAMANGTYLVCVSRTNGERLKNFSVIKRSTN
jgi:hypothetical protein